ncbi:hypothetical protein EDB83DRAFT_2534313 [Lactarius deliciosus]|nr:hypothetical protein EDB83DRAFT_2534313 [Lactarius deliciosus]
MTFDQDPNIGIKGHKAVVRMSEEQPRWLERNVGVLVQLLQSGAFPPGLFVPALNSKVTLDVLCDQIVPPDDPMEDEDKTIHERPEALVVAFLAQVPWTSPRKPLRAQLQGQRRSATKQEDALIDTLIKVLGAISPSMLLRTDAVAGSIQILRGRRGEDHRGHSRLPALVQRGNELVLLLLTRAAEAPWEDLTPGRTPSSPQQCRGYLELSDLLCHAKGAADLAQLLRFYCTSSLMRKMTLGRLPQDSRAFFVARLAGALAPRGHRKSPGSSKLASMGRQLVDALTIIPPLFIQVTPSDVQAWGSSPLVSVLSQISHLADERESPESKWVADLSRAPTRHPLLTKPPPSPSTPPNTKEFVDAPPPSKRKAGGQEPGLKDITSSSSPQQSMYLGASTPVEAADDGDRQRQSSTTTTTKRLKVADEDKPSLLLRMGHQCHPPVGGRGRQGKSPPVRQQQQRSDLPTPAEIPDILVGLLAVASTFST